LGAQRDTVAAAILEAVHLLHDHVGGLAQAAREYPGVLEDGRHPLVEAVGRGDAARGIDDVLVAPLVLADQVPRATDGLQLAQALRLSAGGCSRPDRDLGRNGRGIKPRGRDTARLCGSVTAKPFRPVSHMAGDAPLPDVSEAVRMERIADVLQRVPLAVAVNLVNAGATAWVLARVEPWPGPACWFGVLALISLIRLAFWHSDRRHRFPPARRVAMVALSTLATGLAWGLGAAVLLPDKPAYRLFVVFVVGGMCAGSVTTNAMHFPTLASFVLGASLPVAGRFLAEGSRPDLMMGGMILVFAAALLCTGRQFSRGFGERAMLRWRLGEANLRLRQEIDDHKTTSASLRESQKLEAIGRLTAGIAHDFNNLLMSIGGNIDLLHARSNRPETTRRLESMRGAVERGSQLTRQLLAFGRRQRLIPQAVDLNTILADTVRLLASVLGNRIAVVLRSDADIWP